jgi:hypothetical protein
VSRSIMRLALLLPTDTIEALVHGAIDLAKASEPDRRFNVSAYVSRSNANEPEVLYLRIQRLEDGTGDA